MASNLRALQAEIRARKRGDRPALPAAKEGVIIPGALWYDTAALQPGAQIGPSLIFAGVAKPGAPYLVMATPVIHLCKSFDEASKRASFLSKDTGRPFRLPRPIEARALYGWIPEQVSQPLKPVAIWVETQEGARVYRDGRLALAEGVASCVVVTDATPEESRAINTGKGLKPVKPGERAVPSLKPRAPR